MNIASKSCGEAPERKIMAIIIRMILKEMWSSNGYRLLILLKTSRIRNVPNYDLKQEKSEGKQDL